MTDNPVLRILMKQIEFLGLLIRLFLLRAYYLCLLVRLHLIKVLGAVLIEAVKIEYWVKSMSNGDRVAFAACVAVSIYVVALIFIVRM